VCVCVCVFYFERSGYLLLRVIVFSWGLKAGKALRVLYITRSGLPFGRDGKEYSLPYYSIGILCLDSKDGLSDTGDVSKGMVSVVPSHDYAKLRDHLGTRHWHPASVQRVDHRAVAPRLRNSVILLCLLLKRLAVVIALVPRHLAISRRQSCS